MIRFTVLVPVHNEAATLLYGLDRLLSYVRGFSDNFSILVIENGSSDGTDVILRKATRLHENVHGAMLERANLGFALREGVRRAKSEYLVYMPIDLSVGLDFMSRALELLEEYDVIVGSKRLKESDERRPLIRKICSISYHMLIRILFNVKVTDTTCVKAFRRSRVLKLVDSVQFHDIFDTELLIKAEKTGLRIKEIPVSVSDKRTPRENLVLKIVRKFRSLIMFRILALQREESWRDYAY